MTPTGSTSPPSPTGSTSPPSSAGSTSQGPAVTASDPDAVGLPVRAPAWAPTTGWPPAPSTPAWIRSLAFVATVLAIVSGLIAATGTAALRDDLREIGHRSGRQFSVASETYSVLADLDAHAAAVLLAGTEPATSGRHRAALEAYERRRVEAADKLYQAVAAADGAPEAAALLRRVLHDFGRYQALVAEAMTLDGQRPRPAGETPPAVLARYREAADLMKGSILASAERLAQLNTDRIGRAEGTGRGTARAMTGAALAVGAVLCGVLIFLQVELSRRVRRRLNPGLAAATAVALAFLTVTVGVFTTAAADLRTAEKDTSGSVVVLSEARGISYDANADESRGLLDPARGAEYEKAFQAKYERLDGLLALSFDDTALPGERERAVETLSALREFGSGHAKMPLPAAGRQQEATRLAAGPEARDADDDFDRYILALEAFLLMNQEHLDQSVAAGERGLDGGALVPAAATALVLGLIYAGVRPRLAEYR
ncbi:hypothetical protein ACGFNU_27715 [Spirillospora sp. NPDC048911]|uniref:hypothetical protein n=1 Tax=Spirillospora sp. NPDC048911 TaxID=3364527 RepID=UPI00371AED0C